MLLIASGQYVESELYAEFGDIPPAFLPLGNERLYAHQVRAIGSRYSKVCLTLPDTFTVDSPDAVALAGLNVTVFSTPVEAALRTALRTVLQQLEAEGRVDILFGDTLVLEDELGGTDWIAVGDSDDFYHWHYETDDNAHQGAAWAGMFSFSDATALVRLLGECASFIEAVVRYGREQRPLQRRRLKRWLDFGHVHTYFHSRLAMTTQRHFNSLSVVNGVLTKSSHDGGKMEAEARWFRDAPPAIRPFTPNYIGRAAGDTPGYAIEYLPLTALNELYVFGRLPEKVWKKILLACGHFVETATTVPVTHPAGPDFARRMYGDKTRSRLDTFAAQSGTSLDAAWIYNGHPVPSLRQMAAEAEAAVCAAPCVDAFTHGDFCFSNILFDFRSGRIKVIDPRGLDVDGSITPFGDLRYDIAKLAHSVLGLYDVIVAGFYTLQVDHQYVQFDLRHTNGRAARRTFANMQFAGRTPWAWGCHPMMVLLFLSMLPLHADRPERQRALMANCLRLYLDWKST